MNCLYRIGIITVKCDIRLADLNIACCVLWKQSFNTLVPVLNTRVAAAPACPRELKMTLKVNEGLQNPRSWSNVGAGMANTKLAISTIVS